MGIPPAAVRRPQAASESDAACGPPRQTQVDNIASSNPRLVKNAPAGAFVGAVLSLFGPSGAD